MRTWHIKLIPYLPDNQLRGQWRECALIAHDLKTRGETNHLLINRIMEYPIDDFLTYCLFVRREMARRDFNVTVESDYRMSALGTYTLSAKPFEGWHTKQYLRSNMANLWEKYVCGRGASRLTDAEWERLCEGYENITGEKYQI